MLKYVVSAILICASCFASAEVVQPIGKEIVTMVMSLGSAPFRGTVRGHLELKNNGEQNLTGIVWDLKGHSFRAEDNCPKALAPGKACRIYVQFWNSFPGSASATLRVYTSDKDYIVTVMAYGERDPFENMPNPPRPPIPRP